SRSRAGEDGPVASRAAARSSRGAGSENSTTANCHHQGSGAIRRSAGPTCQSRARSGTAKPGIHEYQGARRRHCEQENGRVRSGASARPTFDGDSSVGRHLGNRKFQRDTTCGHAGGPARDRLNRCLRRSRFECARRQHRLRNGGEIQPAAAGECDGELCEGRPTYPCEARFRRRTGSRAPITPGHVDGRQGACEVAMEEVNPSVPQINPWLIAVAVMFGTFMEVLDTTVVNVSLPHIAGSLSVTPEEATWALTSYLVANAIILPITGWLAS